MASFNDGKSNWNLELNVGLIEDIKEQTGIDLDECIKHPEKMSTMVFASPRELGAMLWVMCEEQAKAVPLTPREFAKRFTREVLDKAVDAFLEAVMLFYPRTSVGGVIREHLPRMLKEMDKKLKTETEANMAKVFSDIATGSRES